LKRILGISDLDVGMKEEQETQLTPGKRVTAVRV